MRNIFAIILLVASLGCGRSSSEQSQNTLDFKSNNSIDSYFNSEEDSIIINVLKESTYAVITFERSQGDLNWYKIFSIKGEKASLIWLNVGEAWYYAEKSNEIQYLEEGMSSKVMPILEACEFISKIKKYGISTLRSEEKLRELCDPPYEWDHPPSTHLILYKQGAFRTMQYSDVSRNMRKCNDVSDWKRMYEIMKLFDKQWDKVPFESRSYSKGS